MNAKNIAKITGVSIIIMAIAAGFAMSQVFTQAFALKTDSLATFLNQSPFFAATAAWVLILLCDIIVSWGLYAYYKNSSKKLAAITGFLRLLYSLILAYGVWHLIEVNFMLYSSASEPEFIYRGIQSFQSAWQFGLIIFGLHLITLSTLVYQKQAILRLIAFLLFFAGLGYFVSNLADLFLENYEDIRTNVELAFIVPMIFGEIGLAVWLIVKAENKLSI